MKPFIQIHHSPQKTCTHTRTISPKLGLMGLLGFLGFAGFLPRLFHITEQFTTPSFFLFFCFFGFFGFYYEGKMSDTLIDERYLTNMHRAAAIANKISFKLLIIISIITVSALRLDTYSILSILIATIGLCFGLSVFLQTYLLYRFENED